MEDHIKESIYMPGGLEDLNETLGSIMKGNP
jgi:hypothetical protein